MALVDDSDSETEPYGKRTKLPGSKHFDYGERSVCKQIAVYALAYCPTSERNSFESHLLGRRFAVCSTEDVGVCLLDTVGVFDPFQLDSQTTPDVVKNAISMCDFSTALMASLRLYETDTTIDGKQSNEPSCTCGSSLTSHICRRAVKVDGRRASCSNTPHVHLYMSLLGGHYYALVWYAILLPSINTLTMLCTGAGRVKRGWLDKYQYDEEDSTAGPTTATFIPSVEKTTFSDLAEEDLEATKAGGIAHLLGGKNVSTKAEASSNTKLFIILAVAAAFIVILIIVTVVVTIIILRKRRMRQRLGAKLDEEERLRQERAKEGKKKKKKKKGKNAEDEANEGEKQADDKEKSAVKEPSAIKDVKSQVQDPKNDEKKSLLNKPDKESNEPNAADIDRMMEMLGNRKMDELMKDPSVDANPADVNKMVKEMMERRMQRARDNA